MTLSIWLDDERTPGSPENTFIHVCRTAEDAIKYIEGRTANSNISAINLWLDHYLGEGMSGYDFCKWLVRWNMGHNIMVGYHILSMNPVGAANMRQLLTHYRRQGYPFAQF